MHKINNKGMTLVELLITFSLLMVLVVGMFNLIMDVKLDLDDKQIIKDYTEYSNYVGNTIHRNLVKDKPLLIVVAESDDYVSACAYSDGSACDPSSGNFSISFAYGNETREYTIPSIKNMCSRVYPCAIYAYQEKGVGKAAAIALNVPDNGEDAEEASTDSETEPSTESGSTETSGTTESGEGETTPATPKEKPLVKSKYGIGVNYSHNSKSVFEKLPSQDSAMVDPNDVFIGFGASNEFDVDIENLDEYEATNAFVIDFPLYKTGSKKNYGFKIVYPFVK